MLPKVTVLVTCKNSSGTIEKCVESLLKIDYPNYRILFIDAFSSDGTYEALKKYERKGNIILRQLKGNAPKAYNYAIGLIRTEFVAFTNADCVADSRWLTEILAPFSDKGVMAVAGLSSNPKKVDSELQRAIGIELERRYREFGRKILRAPEMNLCVRTAALRRLKFDERFDVGYDTDFGYRMNREYGFGSMVYTGKAVIYHYHRATWKALFKQQYKYGRTVPKIYTQNRDAKITGDNVSKPYMPVQIALLYGIFFSAFVAPFWPPSSVLLLTFSGALLLSYLVMASRLAKGPAFFTMVCMFFVRNVAWNLGISAGFLNEIKSSTKQEKHV